MHQLSCRLVFLIGLLAVSSAGAPAPPPPNTDEAKAGSYVLPELMVTNDGRHITDAATWRNLRRRELIEALSVEVYGRTPALPVKVRAKILATRNDAVGVLATRTLVELRPLEDPESPKITISPTGCSQSNRPGEAPLP